MKYLALTAILTLLPHFHDETDMLTDATRIDELIEKRRQEHSTNIVTRRYDDSNHCAMYKDHPDEYNQVADESLAAAIDRRRELAK